MVDLILVAFSNLNDSMLLFYKSYASSSASGQRLPPQGPLLEVFSHQPSLHSCDYLQVPLLCLTTHILQLLWAGTHPALKFQLANPWYLVFHQLTVLHPKKKQPPNLALHQEHKHMDLG